ncbi:hypothetical protein L486_00353 [Kwoniella mangroviensis CBS 10435]|uniref:Uncharacterized protein n=1 Tax=Kwoniella mangroviensis CBS 10435 TaxID=1331196 RepID=A0A1B9IYV4_9TREE|nr:hypothetical protein L486_00353 [Kwoniella mangroviensis CBS 10435]
MPLLVVLLTVSFLANPTSARTALYGACDVKNNHLDVDTKAFVTDCDSFGYCSSNGTCVPRQCRRDEYLLSSLLNTDTPIPPLCPSGTFCPDDASGCLPLVEVDGECQLNRDDECASPPDGTVFVVPSPYDEPEGDGSICLLGKCMWSNITLGQTCLIENTTYVGYDHSGMSFTNTVIRDNCIQGQGYCDIGSNTCLSLMGIKQGCTTDRQCQSYNCERGLCTVPPESSIKVGKWVYALTGVSIGIGMAGVLSILLLMHRRAQKSRRIMLEEYYKEQIGYRNSIISFHSALSHKVEDTSASTSTLEAQEIERTLSNLSEITLVNSRR